MPVRAEEITIGGRKIAIAIADVPLEKVDLDPENPRIKYRLSVEQPDKPLDQVILEMPEVKALKKDIKVTGGLRERIYVQASGDRYHVREGNCRTVCYRALREEEASNPAWQKIPARILPPDISEREVAILLSDWHVAGKITWGAHEKAGYVYHMNVELGMNLEDIALHMRASKSTIQRWKDAYLFMFQTYLKIDKGKYAKEGEKKWSYFDEFFKRKELRDEYKSDPEFGTKFSRWVGQGKIGPPVNVRKLSKIVGNPTARALFEAGAKVNEAYLVIQLESPEEGSQFFTLLAKVRVACTSAASLQDVLRVREDPIARKRVMETYNALRKFMTLASLDPENPTKEAPK